MTSRYGSFSADRPPPYVRGMDAQTYHCPCCHKHTPCFQLRKDVHGVPRRVDVTGVPCADCLRVLDLSQDDHK